jgi:NADH dehydrogenase [ubiquinone] 1 alpha subcomplex assembly factor 2
MRTSDETLNPSPQHAPDESSPGVSNAVKSEEEDATAGAGQGTGQGQDQSQEKQTKKEDPWARAKGPSENWQPEPWAPSAARR